MPITEESAIRASNLWSEMYELKSVLAMENEFQKIAEENHRMRELWSEYSMLMEYGEVLPKTVGYYRGYPLPSQEDYYNRRDRLAIVGEASNEWSEPLFVCPKCENSGVRRKEDYVLASFPPRYIYRCDKCGWQDTHV